MPDIGRVVTTYVGERAEGVGRAFAPTPVISVAAEDLGRGSPETEVAVLAADARATVAATPGLRWVHVGHAGLDGSALGPLLEAGIAVTSAAGRSAPVLAEHALHFMLSLTYRAPSSMLLQRRRTWAPPRGRGPWRGLHGRQVVIVGVGHTGRALAPLCAALGMEVVGFRRRRAPAPPGFERVHCTDDGDRLGDVVRGADIVVLAAGLNDASRHMVGAAELTALGPDGLLVNVARGELVDERALRAALRSGALAGAATDTVAVEPLPPWSPLWRTPGLLITPHRTPPVADRAERALALLAEDVERYRAGRPLLNALGPEDVLHRPPRRTRRPRLERAATHRWARAEHRLARLRGAVG
ncbi:NAD(P)-dependent oxidoreductase [Iamia majanohamensis]|uniref:NAD(P)-dependent oxidoreductase n=1 Tax=Iamia majanohamensis TaxID=467976 RepID=A0AAE9Y8Q6_9ACTN|nr:NAD(P)-dependent oxidoreductase [Iamia majanohamensis]WCO68667.1 NAD(P)-dependent oxidoreductase [Iamia majanohamensis]